MKPKTIKLILNQIKAILFLVIVIIAMSWIYNGVANRRYLQRVYVDLQDQYEIVAFGDSLIEGIGAKQSRGFITRLSEAVEIEIYNGGVRRMQTTDALGLLEERVLRFDPKLVIVSLGANDALRNIPEQTTRMNLFTIVNSIVEDGAHVILLGINDSLLQENYQPIYQELQQFFGEDITVITDFYDPVLLKPKYLFDPLHPNDAGHQLLADNLEPIVRSLIAELNIK